MSSAVVILLAFVLAAFLAIMTTYFLDYFDSSFHTPAEVADTLDIPVVITISKKKIA
jgi:capsular polysaccharide biosynthesis protein